MAVSQRHRRRRREGVGAAGPSARPPGARRLVQRARVHDRGARGRHHPDALHAQRDLRRRLGHPVRRRLPAHRLLPAHARRVPAPLPGPPGDLHRRRADGNRGAGGHGSGRRLEADAASARARTDGERGRRRAADPGGPAGRHRGRQLPPAELHRGAQRRRAVLLLRAQRVRPAGRDEHPLVRRRGRRRAGQARLAAGAGRLAELVPASPGAVSGPVSVARGGGRAAADRLAAGRLPAAGAVGAPGAGSRA